MVLTFKHSKHRDNPPLGIYNSFLANTIMYRMRHCSSSWDMTIHWTTMFTSSTAQGGGGSFKNRKPVGEIGCCESGMAERIHWWTERCLRSPLFLSLSLTIYPPTNLSSMYLSTYLPIYLSTYLPIYQSTYLSIYLSVCLPVCLSVCLSVDLSICGAVSFSVM